MTLTEQIFCAGIVIAAGAGALVLGAKTFDQVDAQSALIKQMSVAEMQAPALAQMAKMDAERRARVIAEAAAN